MIEVAHRWTSERFAESRQPPLPLFFADGSRGQVSVPLRKHLLEADRITYPKSLVLSFRASQHAARSSPIDRGNIFVCLRL